MAINYASWLGGARKWAGAVNWQLLLFKLTACAAILLLVAVGSYREGKADCQIEQHVQTIHTLKEQQNTEREFIREQLKVQETKITQRLQIIAPQSQAAQELRAELRQIRGELHEAITARPANAACAPTDDELRQYEELAERTRNLSGGNRSGNVRSGSVR